MAGRVRIAISQSRLWKAPETHYSALKQGAFGTIRVELLSKGIVAGQGETYVPRMTIGPDESDELIHLPHAISGIDHVQVAEAELALPTHVVADLVELARGTGWLLVAVPSTIASLDLPAIDGLEFSRIAEFSQGLFRCFLYTSNTGPVIDKIRTEVQKTSVNAPQSVDLVKIVDELVHTQPQKLFEVSSSNYGAKEALGIIATRAVANGWQDTSNLRIEISLDDSSWTKSWMHDEGERADFLVVEVSSDTSAEKPIKILVAESKAISSDFEKPNLAKQPLAKAANQVEATRAKLIELIESRSVSLIEGIRFRSFIEHVCSVAASHYTESSETNEFGGFLENLSRFASDGESVLASIDGLACVLFTNGLEPVVANSHEGILLVSCSSQLLEGILNGQLSESYWETAKPLKPGTAAPATLEGQTGPVSSTGTFTPRGVKAGDEVEPEFDENDPDFQAFLNVASALRKRSENIGKRSEDRVSAGPTFLQASFVLKEGSTLAPIIRVAADIARDSGVSGLEIQNGNERGRFEVLIPRFGRIFPLLPGGCSSVGDQPDDYLTIAVGQDLSGRDVYSSLSSWPHALVAGMTGSGKSTFLRSILQQIGEIGGDKVQAVVVDGKGEADYFDLLPEGSFVPEFPVPVMHVSEGTSVLEWLVSSEIPRRKELVRNRSRELGTRFDLRNDYIACVRNGEPPTVKPIIVVIDEFNELMLQGGSTKQAFLDAVTSITQAARSVLVHLILATQRPDRNIVSGAVKANLSTRVSFRLPTPADSITVLGHGGAESLLGKGDFLIQIAGAEEMRLQGYFL